MEVYLVRDRTEDEQSETVFFTPRSRGYFEQRFRRTSKKCVQHDKRERALGVAIFGDDSTFVFASRMRPDEDFDNVTNARRER